MSEDAMPERMKGEPLNKYISKFVSDKSDKKKWPNIKQRLAVAYSEAKKEPKRK